MNCGTSRARPPIERAPSRRVTALFAAILACALLIPAHAKCVNAADEDATRGGDETDASLPSHDAAVSVQAALDTLSEALTAAQSIEDPAPSPDDDCVWHIHLLAHRI